MKLSDAGLGPHGGKLLQTAACNIMVWIKDVRRQSKGEEFSRDGEKLPLKICLKLWHSAEIFFFLISLKIKSWALQVVSICRPYSWHQIQQFIPPWGWFLHGENGVEGAVERKKTDEILWKWKCQVWGEKTPVALQTPAGSPRRAPKTGNIPQIFSIFNKCVSWKNSCLPAHLKLRRIVKMSYFGLCYICVIYNNT